MIPVSTDVVQVQSSLTGESGEFTIDEEALAHVMEVLSGLYSDPEMAVVREYLTNAYDAQIDAGMVPGVNWTPIEITTPSHFQKSFVIRDFGVGMSVDDIRNIFSKYGKSTKRGSNSVVGMLGLGSKSALTYTNSFTITGIKNGVRVKALISKNAEDIPEFNIVDTRATDEPSGVEINIPVKDRNSFLTKTTNLLSFWESGLVKVDGRASERHTFEEIKPGVYVNVTSWGTPPSYIVMGNVPYMIDSEEIPMSIRQANIGFVAYVPIGSVAFAPSRERLKYTDDTKKVINDITSDIVKRLTEDAQKKIDAADTHFGGWLAYNGLPNPIKNLVGTASYRGVQFVVSFRHEHYSQTQTYDDRERAHEGSMLYMSSIEQAGLVVTGVDKTPTPTFKKKVRHYINDNGLKPRALLMDDDNDSVWMAHLPRVTADDIKAIKLPRTKSPGPRTEATYDVWVKDANGDVSFDSLSKVSGNVIYISPADMSSTRYKNGISPITFVNECVPNGHSLVVLSKNRFDKFLRNHPKAVPARQFFVKYVEDEEKKITDAEFMVDEIEYGTQIFLKKVDAADLHDPELREIAKTIQTTKGGKRASVNSLVNRLALASIRVNIPTRSVKFSLNAKYPLLSACAHQRDHGILYANAVYDSLKKGK